MNKLLLVLVVATLSLQVSCHKDKINRPNFCVDGEAKDVGIIGGKTLSKEAWLASGLVAILTKEVDRKTGKDVTGLCTGTLLTKNIILTAAHCVDGRKYGMASSVKVSFGINVRCDLDSDKSDIRYASKVTVHEGYTRPGDKDDLALIQISDEAPQNYHTVELGTEFTKLPSDQKIFLSGYGSEVEYNDENGAVGRLKVAEVFPYVNASSDSMQLVPSTYNNDNATMAFDQRKGQGACAGDSGGPSLLRTSDGVLKVLGVASQVERVDFAPREQADVTCKQVSVYTSVYYYKNWIETEKAKLERN